MMRIIDLCLVVLTLILVGGRHIRFNPNQSPLVLYRSAQHKFHDGNYRGAIQELEKLDNLSLLYDPEAAHVQLELIYSYYQSDDLLRTQAYIDRFIRLNPTNQHMDYVLYMRGITNIALDKPGQALFCVDNSDRDPQYAEAALRDFTQLICSYPHSKYAIDAHKRLVYLKERIAKHQLAIVEYYYKRGAYIAVVHRVEQMLRDFPDSQATNLALRYMENAYQQLQLKVPAQQVANIIAAKMPIIIN